MTVIFEKAWDKYKPGDRAGFGDATEKALVEGGIAFYPADAKPAAAPAPAKEEEVDLSSLKKPALVALAEERGLDSSGTKKELIERLEG